MVIILSVIFILAYIAITLEHALRINKAAVALFAGTVCWLVYLLMAPERVFVLHQLQEQVGEFSGIIFFIMGAMTIVELIDRYDGFSFVTERIQISDKRTLLWVICLFSFVMAAILDNLATAIVMISLLNKMVKDRKDQMLFSGMVIIAVNAGGAWSPIGNVTTTMLWVRDYVSIGHLITTVIFPSIISLVVPLVIISFFVKGKVKLTGGPACTSKRLPCPERNLVFFSGVAVLLFVPIFKQLTHLPPFMGVIFGLGVLWILTEFIRRGKKVDEKDSFSVGAALQRIDMPSVLFFLGILSAVGALQSAGMLSALAAWLDDAMSNFYAQIVSIGLFSAVLDNVPLVAAVMGMYDLDRFATDHNFWTFLSFCAGTGGSILVIGSAPGVATMGLAKLDFQWYLKHITPLALAGYFAGIGVYLLMFAG